MGVHDTCGFSNGSNSELTSSIRERSRVPGWGTWLAFLLVLLFTGICAVVWVKNEYIVAWLLSEGVVEESATRTLPSTVRYIALRSVIAGLVAAALVALWGVFGITPWAPLQVFAAYVRRALRALVSPLWSFVGALFLALGRVLGVCPRNNVLNDIRH